VAAAIGIFSARPTDPALVGIFRTGMLDCTTPCED
jgi:hypothetical protein